MDRSKLTKREYLGTGSWRKHKSKLGEDVFVPCTENEYCNLKKITKLTNLNYTGVSFGGNSLLDTPNGLGSLNDYFIKDGIYYVYEITQPFGNLNEVSYTEEEFSKKYV